MYHKELHRYQWSFQTRKLKKVQLKVQFVFPDGQLDLFITALQCDWDEDADFRKFESSVFACNYGPFGKKSCKYVVYEFSVLHFYWFWSYYCSYIICCLGIKERTTAKVCNKQTSMKSKSFFHISRVSTPKRDR